MKEQIFKIKVQTEKELSKDEIWEIAHDFMHRLQGYNTECPEVLKKAKMFLEPDL